MKKNNKLPNDIVISQKNKKKQLLSSQSSFDLSYRSSQRTSLYNALEDHHASRYFVSLSVKKHLESMAKVHECQNSHQAIDALPKSTENQKVIKVMNRIATLDNNLVQIPTSIKAKGYRQKRSLTFKDQSHQTDLALKPIKIKKSPYYSSLKPRALAKPQHKSSFRSKDKILSRLSLPPLETEGPDVNIEKRITHVPIKSRLSLAADCRVIDKLHRLRHNYFQSFLDKKREQLLSNSGNLKSLSIWKQISK